MIKDIESRSGWKPMCIVPARAMASHISTAPNHQIFHTIFIKFRIDVADGSAWSITQEHDR